MNFKIFCFSFFLIGILSCAEKISLEQEMNCSFLTAPINTTEKSDINKNFSIQIPNRWKYNVYFDDTQSTIYMADTIKELIDTYILDASIKYGELHLDQDFENKAISAPDLSLLKSNFENFKDYPAYWVISKGVRQEYTYHLFNLFVKLSEMKYLEIKTEMYGEQFVDERLCESFELINSVKILK